MLCNLIYLSHYTLIIIRTELNQAKVVSDAVWHQWCACQALCDGT